MGLVHIYFGEGKGKTSAAAGIAVRAAGQGMRVHFIQFMKGGNSGEINILRKIDGITVIRCSRSYNFTANMNQYEQEQITKEHNTFLKTAIKIIESEDMIIIDEFFSAYNCGLCDRSLAKKLVSTENRHSEIILTGHDPDSFFLQKADYISEIKAVKHPFEKGITARRGIEF